MAELNHREWLLGFVMQQYPMLQLPNDEFVNLCPKAVWEAYGHLYQQVYQSCIKEQGITQIEVVTSVFKN